MPTILRVNDDVLSNNNNTINSKYIPNAGYHDQGLRWILKFIPHYNSRSEVPFSPFHRWRNQGLQRLGNLLMLSDCEVQVFNHEAPLSLNDFKEFP